MVTGSSQIKFKLEKNKEMRILIVVFIILLCIFQYNLWFSKNGIIDVMQLKRNIAKQEKINQDLDQYNQRLLAKIHILKQEKSTVEELAREQLGMIKKGETYYRFVK